jgi:hypothetical protein
MVQMKEEDVVDISMSSSSETEESSSSEEDTSADDETYITRRSRAIRTAQRRRKIRTRQQNTLNMALIREVHGDARRSVSQTSP